ncbi:tetratricopeptide repeat protein, partial [bacterium]|nr:tetratricopeptide repeat protein [bacterium]
MTTPLELARELDVRVEALLSALSELGASPVDYEAPLTAEDEEYLRLRFAPFQKRSFWRSLLGRFRRRPSPEQLDRELFERALPALGAAPPLVSVPPAPAPWDVGEDLSAALAAADTLSLPRTTGERETSPPLTRDEGGHPPAVAGGEAGMESPPESLSTDVLGDIDLSALLGATDLPTAESTQPSGGPEEGDIDLSELLGVAAEPSQAAASAVESTPTPEEMLGLRFESEEGEDDFDLQALLESSVAEPEAAPASKAGGKAKEEPPAVATTPVPTTAPATASATAPLSRWQKVWVGAAAAIMLALAAFVGRYSWVYYQEHRPGGDQRLYDQGVAYLDEEAYDKAAGRLSTLIQNYPDSSLSELAFFKYGEALFGQGKYPAAISTYRRALAFQEQRVKATEAMDYPDILRRQEAQRQIARGMGLSGNYEDAVHEYRQLLELYRNDEIERELKVELAELYSRWGTARGEARPLEMAIGLYQIAAAEHPDAQETVGWYDAAGQAAMALAQLVPASAEEYQADAREALETALAAGDRLGFLPGEEAMLLSRLGRVAEALGDDARTAAAYRRLLSASPELPEEAQAYTGLAQIEMRRAEWHRQEAMRILRRLEARGMAVAVQPPAAGALGDETAVDEKS